MSSYDQYSPDSYGDPDDDSTPAPKKSSGLPGWAWALIIVFVIGPIGLVGLSVTAAIAIPSLMAARFEANEKKIEADLRSFTRAIEAYHEIHGTYPHRLAELAEPTRATGSGYRALGHTTFVDYPNGGLRSSACDVARFLAATSTDGGGVLSAETLDLAQAVAFPALDDRQGLGWYREDLGERTLWIGHSGAEEGVATDAFARPDGSLGVVLLANGDWPRGDALLALEDALIAAYR